LGILSFVHSTVWKVLFGKVSTFYQNLLLFHHYLNSLDVWKSEINVVLHQHMKYPLLRYMRFFLIFLSLCHPVMHSLSRLAKRFCEILLEKNNIHLAILKRRLS